MNNIKAPNALVPIIEHIIQAYSLGYTEGFENGQALGYLKGLSDGSTIAYAELIPAVSDGLRAGSSECGKVMRSLQERDSN